MPELAFFRYGEELLRIPLGDRIEIGRSPACDVVIPDPSISRNHAVVEQRGETFYLVDRSGRGTRVGGQNVSEVALQNGIEIELGNWQAIFRDGLSPSSTKTQTIGNTVIRSEREARPTRSAFLRVRRNGRERIVPLKSDLFRIGKDPSNHLVVDDPYVSSRHARFELRDGRWFVKDLGSRNGTLLSGARILHGEVQPGATVTIGDMRLTLEVEGAWAASSGVATAFEGMTSNDPGMLRVFETIERIADSAAAAMILGETGSGIEASAARNPCSGRRAD